MIFKSKSGSKSSETNQAFEQSLFSICSRFDLYNNLRRELILIIYRVNYIYGEGANRQLNIPEMSELKKMLLQLAECIFNLKLELHFIFGQILALYDYQRIKNNKIKGFETQHKSKEKEMSDEELELSKEFSELTQTLQLNPIIFENIQIKSDEEISEKRVKYLELYKNLTNKIIKQYLKGVFSPSIEGYEHIFNKSTFNYFLSSYPSTYHLTISKFDIDTE